MNPTIERWHRALNARDTGAVADLLHDSVEFHSPALYQPVQGKPQVMFVLAAALEVVANPSFRYVREIIGKTNAMLEFETEIGGKAVNGVDIFTWDDAGRITEFKVMVRPWSALEALKGAMAERLARQA